MQKAGMNSQPKCCSGEIAPAWRLFFTVCQYASILRKMVVASGMRMGIPKQEDLCRSLTNCQGKSRTRLMQLMPVHGCLLGRGLGALVKRILPYIVVVLSDDQVFCHDLSNYRALVCSGDGLGICWMG